MPYDNISPEEVTSAGTVTVVRGDSPENDSFGRLRVSEPTTLFDTQLQYSDQPLFWSTLTSGTSIAQTSHLPDESSLRLEIGDGVTDAVVRETKQYARYQPGKSQQVVMTGVLGSQTSNLKRMGYFDDENGVFWEQSGITGSAMVLRSNVTGTVVENRVAQADWSVDSMIGVGPSGVSLDATKAQLLYLDFEWLSVGRVRTLFIMDGVNRPVHDFLNANNRDFPYMTTANLPMRYEIRNEGESSRDSMKQLCNEISVEGGFDDDLGVFHSSAETTGTAVTTRQPILTVRPKATFGSGITNRGVMVLEGVQVITSGNDCFWEVVYGGTINNTPSFVDVGTNSLAESDSAATLITGGEVLDSGFAVAGQGQSTGVSETIGQVSKLPWVLDSETSLGIPISIVATSLNATATARCNMTWKELY